MEVLSGNLVGGLTILFALGLTAFVFVFCKFRHGDMKEAGEIAALFWVIIPYIFILVQLIILAWNAVTGYQAKPWQIELGDALVFGGATAIVLGTSIIRLEEKLGDAHERGIKRMEAKKRNKPKTRNKPKK